MITNIAIALMILGSDMDTFVLKVLTNICCNKVVLLQQISAVSFYQIFLGFFFLNDLKETVKNKSFPFLFFIFVYTSEASIAFLHPLKEI